MGKNITIQEGGTPRTFGNVEKIVTNVVGGGTQNWIPEEEAASYVETGELSVSENGTYYSSDEGYVGFSKVDVRVTDGGGGATLIEKEITENGTYLAEDDDADGYSKVEVDVTPTPGQPMPQVDSYGNQWSGGVSCLSILQTTSMPIQITPILTISNI